MFVALFACYIFGFNDNVCGFVLLVIFGFNDNVCGFVCLLYSELCLLVIFGFNEVALYSLNLLKNTDLMYYEHHNKCIATCHKFTRYAILNNIIHSRVIGCGAAEATGMGFVCFVAINPCVLSANRVDLGLFYFINFQFYSPPPLRFLEWQRRSCSCEKSSRSILP